MIYNSSKTIELPHPTRSGYIFASWNTEPDGSGTDYYSESEMLINKEITLYAQWVSPEELMEGDYSITYDFGDIVFDGASILNTNLKILDKNNYYRNFEITYDAEDYSFNSGQNDNKNSFVSCMDESGSPWPGFVYRNNANNVNNNLNANVTSSLNKTVQNSTTSTNIISNSISKVSNMLKVNGTNVIDMTNLAKSVEVPLTFGASLDGNLNPFRFSTLKMKNVKVKIYYDSKRAVNLSEPTLTGYTFTGWTGSNGTIPEHNISVNKGNEEDKIFRANFISN